MYSNRSSSNRISSPMNPRMDPATNNLDRIQRQSLLTINNPQSSLGNRPTSLDLPLSQSSQTTAYKITDIVTSQSPVHPKPFTFRSNTLFDETTFQRILHDVTSKTTWNICEEMYIDEDEVDQDLIQQDYDLDHIFIREEMNNISSGDEDEDEDNVIDNDNTENNKLDQDEQDLSQKFSQLSTRSALVDIEDNYGCPDYLQSTNRWLNERIDSILQQAKLTSANYEDFRLLAIDIHQIRYHQILQSLWTAYLQSGLGQLKTRYGTNHINECLWPLPIRDMVKPIIGSGVEEHVACHSFIVKRLNELEKIIRERQSNLHNRIKEIQDYSSIIQSMLETFIDENLTMLRQKMEHKIQLIYYDYEEHQIELQYLQNHPNQDQIKLARERCLARQKREVATYELELLKKQIINDENTPMTFDSQPFANVPIFDRIDQFDVRQELYVRYKAIIDQSRSSILKIYLHSATSQKERYDHQYHAGINTFWQNQRALSNTQKLSPMMIDLIERRSNIVAERIQCVYNYKIALLEKK